MAFIAILLMKHGKVEHLPQNIYYDFPMVMWPNSHRFTSFKNVEQAAAA